MVTVLSSSTNPADTMSSARSLALGKRSPAEGDITAQSLTNLAHEVVASARELIAKGKRGKVNDGRGQIMNIQVQKSGPELTGYSISYKKTGQPGSLNVDVDSSMNIKGIQFKERGATLNVDPQTGAISSSQMSKAQMDAGREAARRGSRSWLHGGGTEQVVDSRAVQAQVKTLITLATGDIKPDANNIFALNKLAQGQLISNALGIFDLVDRQVSASGTSLNHYSEKGLTYRVNESEPGAALQIPVSAFGRESEIAAQSRTIDQSLSLAVDNGGSIKLDLNRDEISSIEDGVIHSDNPLRQVNSLVLSSSTSSDHDPTEISLRKLTVLDADGQFDPIVTKDAKLPVYEYTVKSEVYDPSTGSTDLVDNSVFLALQENNTVKVTDPFSFDKLSGVLAREARQARA